MTVNSIPPSGAETRRYTGIRCHGSGNAAVSPRPVGIRPCRRIDITRLVDFCFYLVYGFSDLPGGFAERSREVRNPFGSEEDKHYENDQQYFGPANAVKHLTPYPQSIVSQWHNTIIYCSG